MAQRSFLLSADQPHQHPIYFTYTFYVKQKQGAACSILCSVSSTKLSAWHAESSNYTTKKVCSKSFTNYNWTFFPSGISRFNVFSHTCGISMNNIINISQKTASYSCLHEHVINIVVQPLSCVQLFVTLWTAAHQASLSFTISPSLLKLMSIESMMPSNYLILCPPLLLLPSVFHRIRVFPNESGLRIRWPMYWSFSFSVSPSNEYTRLISFTVD